VPDIKEAVAGSFATRDFMIDVERTACAKTAQSGHASGAG
jgi:hypothetical protein